MDSRVVNAVAAAAVAGFLFLGFGGVSDVKPPEPRHTIMAADPDPAPVPRVP